MSNVVRFKSRRELELKNFRERTVVSLQPRLDAIAKQRKQREQEDLVRRVVDRASHMQDLVLPRPKLNEAEDAAPGAQQSEPLVPPL